MSEVEKKTENEIKTYWDQNKKLIGTTVGCVFAALVAIKFFDLIFAWVLLAAFVAACVLTWTHFSQKYGGSRGILKALKKELDV